MIWSYIYNVKTIILLDTGSFLESETANKEHCLKANQWLLLSGLATFDAEVCDDEKVRIHLIALEIIDSRETSSSGLTLQSLTECCQ